MKFVFKDVIEQGEGKTAIRFYMSLTSLLTGEKIKGEAVLYMTGKNGKLVEGTWYYDATFMSVHAKKSSFVKAA